MSQTIIPRAAVQGTATGVLFMAFFGTLWAGIGVGGLEGWGFAWLLTLSLLIGVALLLAGLLLIRAARGPALTGRGSWRCGSPASSFRAGRS